MKWEILFTDRRQSLARSLQARGLERFHFYARKVRTLGRPREDLKKDIHYLVLPALSSWSGGTKPLLPNVTELFLQLQDFEGMAVIPSLAVGPLLRTVTVMVAHPPADVAPSIVEQPSTAILSADMLHALKKLDTNSLVYIISRRDGAFLE